MYVDDAFIESKAFCQASAVVKCNNLSFLCLSSRHLDIEEMNECLLIVVMIDRAFKDHSISSSFTYFSIIYLQHIRV